MEHKARAFAFKYHNDICHKRKYTNEPYTNHLLSVAEIVRSVKHTEAMICAAWLHDAVEDTTATLNDIESFFGNEVATLVEMLTDVSKLSDGNRATRKAIDREHTAKASREAKTIKLADLIDNSQNILLHDRNFAKVYLKEKSLLMRVLCDGDLKLQALAHKILTDNAEFLRD